MSLMHLKRIFVVMSLIAVSILYYFFINMTLNNDFSIVDKIKYSIVIIIAVAIAVPPMSKLHTLVLSLILIADYLLLFTQFFTSGIIVFIAVQLTIAFMNKIRLLPLIAVCTCFSLIVLVITHDLMFAIGAFYALALVTNTVKAYFTSFLRRKFPLRAIALSCLMLCDLFVLINQTNSSINIFMWIFYVPFLVLFLIDSVARSYKTSKFI